MADNHNHKIKVEDISYCVALEEVLLKLNRLSHFIDHDVLTRQHIFQKAISINYNIYFIHSKETIEPLTIKLTNKLQLLNESEYENEDIHTKNYVKRIWDDIFSLLEKVDDKINSSIRRFERGLNNNYLYNIEDLSKTSDIISIEKLHRRKYNEPEDDNLNSDNFLNDEDFSHGLF